ncbi:DNA-binding transcriptional MerR regulator [Labedella gwakjiensis]|uniref:DNA-binding transcriptional MerR regulator n=1 Tax=Labedella gwakjiensis TaxID=390269 RepID=A0A2P8GVA4_9MICO|nr:MerR family transcriptional regulator [Labedella gwakjiensis]PSL37898.1 DNA-binding transcriptional MerR regulator [Labedella gwakjiensis]RUQ87533.1 MerR family transcriptional regulator [Labedella gwakjiensis]
MSDIRLPDVGTTVPDGGLSIGDTATVLGLPVETLRYYDRAGLLLDPTPRDAGGRRRYGTADLAWIAGLVMLRETGMSIADIRVIAELSRTPGTEAERLVLFREHRKRVLEKIAQTQRHLAAIDAKIAAYEAAVEGTNE